MIDPKKTMSFRGPPARAAHTFDPPQKAGVFLGTRVIFAVSRYEELHKIGKLAENRRFFAKLTALVKNRCRATISVL